MVPQIQKKDQILLLGSGKLSYSVAACLIKAGHFVRLITKENNKKVLAGINFHFANFNKEILKTDKHVNLEITNVLGNCLLFELAIVIVEEELLKKGNAISQLEGVLASDAIIAINTESIPLKSLQMESRFPGRILGLNWTEPAHTTYFTEIITNSKSDKTQVNRLFNLAKNYWQKDPYIVCYGLSIRAKMFAAMIREAFYLVENGYASFDDIDKACRNDAGYYLPFAGNFRFMDLMGTYAYGAVMKDLNPVLSTDKNLPKFFEEIISQGGLGMENGKGFYEYGKDEVEKWEELFIEFSYQIQQIISKYPFNYKDERTEIKSEVYE